VKGPHPALSLRERGKSTRRKVFLIGVREKGNPDNLCLHTFFYPIPAIPVNVVKSFIFDKMKTTNSQPFHRIMYRMD
jgi:metallophosphoesterase superfamily enzyme